MTGVNTKGRGRGRAPVNERSRGVTGVNTRGRGRGRAHVVASVDSLPRQPPALEEEHVRVRLLHCPFAAGAAGLHEGHADAEVISGNQR